MYKERWVLHGVLQQHLIELFHSPISRELLIRLDGRDLYHEKVETNKLYQFFVDSDLCEIVITKNANGFKYTLNSPELSTSKLGKANKRKNLLQKFGIGFGFLSILLFIIFFGMRIIKWHHNNELSLAFENNAAENTTTTAVIVKLGPKVMPIDTSYFPEKANNNQNLAVYAYSVNSDMYFGTVELPFNNLLQAYIAPTGWPVDTGSRFKLVYHKDDPTLNWLFLERPDSLESQRYRQLALNSCAKYHANNNNNNVNMQLITNYCHCLVEQILQNNGVNNLKYVYYLGQPNYHADNDFTLFWKKPENKTIDSKCRKLLQLHK